MEKFCPGCSRVYDSGEFCEVDGERLLVVEDEPSLVGHVLDGKYTMTDQLGEGGMGRVYLAEQSSMQREVAIKVLRRAFSQNKTAIQRFLREARAASKLAHPNTITVYDFGQSNDGLLYLVMERLTGRPLDLVLDEDGAMDPRRAVHIIAQICDSLSEAHRHGITHRDLKPENIFIQQQVGNPDFVKVLDFGIAKMAGEEATQATKTGMICGTPAYMSPEQAMGRDIDGRSDVYALGILLYEMLTDEKPFDGDTPMEIMLKHINEGVPDALERTGVALPIGLQTALEKMLAKKPEDRPADCQALKALVLEALETPIATAGGASAPVRSPEATADTTVDARPGVSKKAAPVAEAATLVKTGLSPAVSADYVDDIPPKASKSWLWAALLVLALGGGGFAWWSSQQGDAPDNGMSNQGKVAVSAPATDRVVAEKKPTAGVGTAGSENTKASSSKSAEPVAGKAAGTKKVDTDTAKPEEPKKPVESARPAEDKKAKAPVPVVRVVQAKPAAPAKPTTAGRSFGSLLADSGSRAYSMLAASVVPVAAATVSLTVVSSPSGAGVYEHGVQIGTTPLSVERTQGSPPVVWTVRHPKYRNKTVSFGTQTSRTESVQLRRIGKRSGGKSGKSSTKASGNSKSFGTF